MVPFLCRKDFKRDAFSQLQNMFTAGLIVAITFPSSVGVLSAAPTVDKKNGDPTQTPRPNVVVIMTDNHGAWTLGCYGNPDVRTPHIDKLAREGTLFTRAFASNPVCSPTRATFLTGLIPSQHGVHSFLAGGGLQTGPNARCTLDQFTSLPEVLKESGYACGLVGKWHLGGNMQPQEGFDDYWITMPHGGTSTFYDAMIIENGKQRKEPTYLTDFWTQHAVKFIEKQADDDEKPFFLFLSYNGPYALSRLLLKEGKNRHAAYYADKELPSFPRVKTHPWQYNNRDFINNPTSIQRVATEVSGVDDGVGEVMQALKDQGIDDNTIVIFLADQGWVGGHGGFFGMGDHTRPLTARDGMMQIPLIFRHPRKIAAGERTDQMIANYDVMPTILGHLGMAEKMPLKPKSPGVDFSGILRGAYDDKADHDAIFYEFENLRCIRTSEYKYVHRHPNGPHELYHLDNDPDEFTNLVSSPKYANLRDELKLKLKRFYEEHASPKYDMWKGGTSQVRIHDGIDEERAQLASVTPPPLPDGYEPAPLNVPQGYTAELVAGPPLVTHPTMACFDDSGHLYVCNNAGVNLSNTELEEQLPNSIRRLVDADQDGTFDSYTVFADKMTFPMGGVWHDGSLYVASPPNIWKLTDTDDDGIADERKVIVSRFGYNGNAASIHGCFFGPDGRLYWTDGYHGHEFKDDEGHIKSKRAGSYLFSCRADGSDAQIHCGGGMDNPVEIDFTDSGDMLGTVNILYTRPRVDCMVHWLHGGAYPHREKVLDEIQITGDVLEPAHRFGHVAVSGMARYRSGVMDHRWRDNWFTTFFNSGKVVRLSMEKSGSSYQFTQHEFLSSTSREFHPTDILEDADGSLLVIDTGGWFYRGCPTSQLAKPDLLGGIYRIRRDGMTTQVDPRGQRIDWRKQTPGQLIRLLNDTRWTVREQAKNECVKREAVIVPLLKTSVARGDLRVRNNALWVLTRLASEPATAKEATLALRPALKDAVPEMRQAACRGLSRSVDNVNWRWLESLLQDSDPGVRRQAATTLGMLGQPDSIRVILTSLGRDEMDRSEEHALIYALIEINDAGAIQAALKQLSNELQSNERLKRSAWIAMDQIAPESLSFDQIAVGLTSSDLATRNIATGIAKQHPQWVPQVAILIEQWLQSKPDAEQTKSMESLFSTFIAQKEIAELAGEILNRKDSNTMQPMVLRAIAKSGSISPHESWIQPLQQQLRTDDDQELALVLSAVTAISGHYFDEQLQAISVDKKRIMAVRMSALSVLTSRSRVLDEAMLDRLITLYRSGSPAAVSQAASIIGSARLTSAQLVKIVPLITHASPTDLRQFLSAFGSTREQVVATAFLTSLESADALLSLSEPEVSDVVKRFPPETLAHGNKILDRLKQHHQTKLSQLENIRKQLVTGDATRGEQVFLSKKAKCATCHRIGKTGKQVGPDLTTIGANRSANDLLESITFPSASIVRDYVSYKVMTIEGRVFTGIVVGETSDSIELQQANGETVTIKQDNIEQLAASPLSIMPAGLDEALTRQELLDVVKYLQQLH